MAANPNPNSNVQAVLFPNGDSKFGGPPNNGNRAPLGANNFISTQDYTGRLAAGATKAQPTLGAANDIASPLALAGVAVAQAIAIPPNAVSMKLVGSAAFAMSEFGTVGAPLVQYATIPANALISIDVARQATLFVAGTGNLSFWFSVL